MKKKTEVQLHRIINDARNSLREIEDKRLVKELKQHVGKCFKFKNSFGSGESWWLYCKAIRLDDTSLVFFQFQKDSRGRWEIETYGNHCLNDLYITISGEEFQSRWIKCLEELNGFDV